ncbi:MAG: ATP-binding protein [Chloroflexota bacterium]
MDNANQESRTIGYIIGGGLKESFRARLTVPPIEVQEGAFVIIENSTPALEGDWLFYGLVTDIQLGATDPRFADEQSEARFPSALAGLLHGQTLFTNLEILPALMLERGPLPGAPGYERFQQEIMDGIRDVHPVPVKTVPPHHSPVKLAAAGDIAEIFGNPEDEGNFVIGTTREQDLPVCINLEKFVQRSSGIFGATGTGKSFLTRIVLAGLIKYDKSSVLVFDMHNEYAFEDKASDTKKSVPGLKDKFGVKVQVVGLGSNAQIRNNTPDFNLQIAMSDIQAEDVELLTRELNLKETTPTTLDALVNSFGRDGWFKTFKEMKPDKTIETDEGKRIPSPDSVEAWANEAGIHPGAAKGLHSKLGPLFRREYIVEKPAVDTLRIVIQSLAGGKHIVLSFGRFEADLDYLLVTNLLTRRIREEWERLTNTYRSGKEKSEPRPLVIVVEEAHKLLNREMAAQTTFSTIAREMRKYFVTLLIIDQRPSQIYDEVMSQLGTRITGWLGDDDDVHAVLSGLAGRDALRGMLSHLQPKEEILLLGWTMPMPLPVRSRRYDEKFWQELIGESGKRSKEQLLKEMGY